MRALLLAATILIATTARADVRPRVAVLELSLQGKAAPELRAQLERSLAAGLDAGGFDVVGRDAVAARMRAQPELAGCVTTTCLERLGGLLGVDRFVRGRVEAEGAAYAVRVELMTFAKTVRVVDQSCPVCTLAEANDLVRMAGAELGPFNRKLVSVIVRTEPPGLPVAVDAQPRGTSPIELSLAPGKHVFQVILDGKPGAEVIVDVAAPFPGEPMPVTLSAQPAAPAIAELPEAPAEAPRWGKWKWAAIGGGGALLLGGIWLFAVDGNEVDCAEGRPCRLLRETTALAAITTILGVGGVGLGVWMFLDDAKREPRARAALVPRRGGAVLVVSGRF